MEEEEGEEKGGEKRVWGKKERGEREKRKEKKKSLLPSAGVRSFDFFCPSTGTHVPTFALFPCGKTQAVGWSPSFLSPLSLSLISTSTVLSDLSPTSISIICTAAF